MSRANAVGAKRKPCVLRGVSEGPLAFPSTFPSGWASYLLLCSDGSFYCGTTRHLRVRLTDHASGKGSIYTKKKMPLALVWFEPHPSRNSAAAKEREIKKWGRTKKKSLAEAAGVWVSLVPNPETSGRDSG